MAVNFDVTKIPLPKAIPIAASIIFSLCPPLLIIFKVDPEFFLRTEIFKLLLLAVSAGCTVLLINSAIFIYFWTLIMPAKPNKEDNWNLMVVSLIIPLFANIFSYLISGLIIFYFPVTFKQTITTFLIVNGLLLMVIALFLWNSEIAKNARKK